MLHNQKIIRVLSILLMVMTMNLSNALASTDPDDPSLNDPADIPVDGGISLLLAAGAVYGARRLKRVAGGNDGTDRTRPE
jgi:hypothetical protein